MITGSELQELDTLLGRATGTALDRTKKIDANSEEANFHYYFIRDLNAIRSGLEEFGSFLWSAENE